MIVKRKICKFMILFAVMTGVLCTPVMCHTEEKNPDSDMVAAEEEMVTPKSVKEEDMIPVSGTDVKDGSYSVETESSSSMFRIVKAKLIVSDGKMTAVITLSGTGYSKLYMGTGQQAVAADESEYIVFEKDEKGAYTYTIPVEALNQELECSAFSKRKEKWYDRQILFRADTLPQKALLKQINPVEIDRKDGNYTVEVSLAGGTGRAKIASPASVTVTDQVGTIKIQWDSPYYDYMIVNGEKILPVNTEGDSLFEIPIWALDEKISITADTTAMGTPHEIEYELTIHSDTFKKEGQMGMIVGGVTAVLCIIVGIVIIQIYRKKKVLNV